MSLSTPFRFHVQGMSCAHCVGQVTQALKALPGVAEVDVHLASGLVRVIGDSAMQVDQLVAALEDEGYPTQVLEEDEA